MPNAEINNVAIYYEMHGDGLPVLYIHGGMGGARTVVKSYWDTGVPGFRFIFFDRRGCGRSEAPATDYNLGTFADDALGLLDHLGIGRAVVLGNSSGGPVALQMALLQPHRIMALVLTNTSPNIWPEDDAEDTLLVRELLRVVESEGAEAAYKKRPQQVKYSLQPFWSWPEAEAHGWLSRAIAEERQLAEKVYDLPWSEQTARHVAELRTCQTYIGVDLTPELARIHCPALLVHGETDAMVPFSGSEVMAHNLPKAELVAIPDAGHMILDHPEARLAIARFLRKIADNDSGLSYSGT